LVDAEIYVSTQEQNSYQGEIGSDYVTEYNTLDYRTWVKTTSCMLGM